MLFVKDLVSDFLWNVVRGGRERERERDGEGSIVTLLRLSKRRLYSSRISCSRGVNRGEDLDGLLGLLWLLVAMVQIFEVGVQRDCGEI